jgi:hypothetical protein
MQKVQQYIANQEEHHRQVPFDQEWKAYLRSHGFEPHEEELWE